MLKFPNKLEDATDAAFANPVPGDYFHEMFTWWVFVIWRDGDQIAWMSRAAPCTFPEDARLYGGTLDEFRAAYAYGSIPGYSVMYAGRKNVEGWLDQRIGEFAADLEAS